MLKAIWRFLKSLTSSGIYLTEQQIHNLEQQIELPVLTNTPVFLNWDEVAVYYCQATLQETKHRVVGRTGRYSGSSFRLMKGYSVHSGRSYSKPIYGDVSTHYPGQLVLTNQRLVFLNNQKGFEVAYHTITAATAYRDGLAVQSHNRTYKLLLPKAHLAVLAFDAVRNGDIPIAGTQDVIDTEYEEIEETDSLDVGETSIIDTRETDEPSTTKSVPMTKLDEYLANKPPFLIALYRKLQSEVYDVVDDVSMGFTKDYISWSVNGKHFAEIYIQKQKIVLLTFTPMRKYNLGERLPDSFGYVLNYRTHLTSEAEIETIKDILMESYSQRK